LRVEAGLPVGDGRERPVHVRDLGDGRERPVHLQDTPNRRAPKGSASPTFFPQAQLSDNGFGSIGEFLETVKGRLADPRLIQASQGGSEGVGADGGFLSRRNSPRICSTHRLEDEIVRPRALAVQMEYNSAFVAGFNTQDHSATIGGFTGVWQAEGVKFAPQKGLIRGDDAQCAKARDPGRHDERAPRGFALHGKRADGHAL